MTTPTVFKLPDDFAERCKQARTRVDGGEVMTIQNLADAFGLPFEFVSAALALTTVLMSGKPVIVDPGASKLN